MADEIQRIFMKLKKLVCTILAVTMLCGMFAGCNKSASNEDERMTIDWLMFSAGPKDKDSPVEKYSEDMWISTCGT